MQYGTSRRRGRRAYGSLVKPQKAQNGKSLKTRKKKSSRANFGGKTRIFQGYSSAGACIPPFLNVAFTSHRVGTNGIGHRYRRQGGGRDKSLANSPPFVETSCCGTRSGRGGLTAYLSYRQAAEKRGRDALHNYQKRHLPTRV